MVKARQERWSAGTGVEKWMSMISNELATGHPQASRAAISSVGRGPGVQPKRGRLERLMLELAHQELAVPPDK
jgi:hypothetical protein